MIMIDDDDDDYDSACDTSTSEQVLIADNFLLGAHLSNHSLTLHKFVRQDTVQISQLANVVDILFLYCNN